MLEDGLSYPMEGDSWIARILIGGVLLFLSFLVVPIFIFQGYLLRVLGDTVRGESEPPEWDDWGGLVVDGLKATVVAFVYSIIPIAVIGGIGVVLLGAGSAAGGDGGGILAGFGLLTVLLAIPVFFLIYLLVPAALANMAVEGSLGAAFDLNLLKDVVFTADYLVAVLMPIVVGIAVNIVTQVLAITIVGLLLVPFITFYGQVAVFRMFGLAFANQTDGSSGGATGTTATV
ncbi:DUF4013 domain-containing protein [Haloarcula litorea]|uniref:DUF4013 domain-containing protein n=1 Tax=Haloarcula litorea TaxID=3032579 RepID=UPI0023E757B2|nr:DUF4013 domain-containing protein [Halomicroarcula sp. GDY20]